jgi:formamidase
VGEELVTDVLDLDAVSRVREHGLAGVSRMWEQAMRAGPAVELPVYGGRIQPQPE